MMGTGRLLQRFGDQAVPVALHGDQLHLAQAQHLHVAQEGGAFHQHRIARVQQRVAEQPHALGSPGNRQQRALTHLQGQMLPQILRQALRKGRITLRGPILQDPLPVGKQNLPGQLRTLGVGQGLTCRVPSRERNHVGLGRHLEDLPNGAAGDVLKPLGKGSDPLVHARSSSCGK